LEKEICGAEKVLGIVRQLKQSNLFTDIEVLELIDEETINLLKIKAQIRDGSILFITELATRHYQKYSYHWQRQNGEIIMRWDNKPHWRNLKTFPHHKHIKGHVVSCARPDIKEIIDEIRGYISRKE
jgi:hypothetical protein